MSIKQKVGAVAAGGALILGVGLLFAVAVIGMNAAILPKEAVNLVEKVEKPLTAVQKKLKNKKRVRTLVVEVITIGDEPRLVESVAAHIETIERVNSVAVMDVTGLDAEDRAMLQAIKALDAKLERLSPPIQKK